MNRKRKNKKVNFYGEATSFIAGYSEGILTISHLIKRLQTFGRITELHRHIKESMIAGGNHAHTKKGDDLNE